ncbi:Catsper1 [Symbiodinium sp. KB8]|nr:Catsper1 [Symbiodinium sp. KB8]
MEHMASIQESLYTFRAEQEALVATLSSLVQQVDLLCETADTRGIREGRRRSMKTKFGARAESEFFSADAEDYAISTYLTRITGAMQETDDDYGMEKENSAPADTCMDRWRARCQWLLALYPFDYCMGVVLLVNSIFVGIEVQSGLVNQEAPAWATPLDVLFVGLYLIEITIRLVGWGWHYCFTDGWFAFDFVSVVLGSASIIAQLLGPLIGSTELLSFLNSVIVVRSLRLLRLVRALRMLRWFRTAWRLVFGLLTSGTTMTSTLGLVLLTLYVSACLGVELISKDPVLMSDPTTEFIVEHHFGSLTMTMLTLAQFVTLDSIAAIYRPLVYLKPVLVIYFSGIILVLSISLMNLVTAVLVEGALENAQHDRELKRHVLQEKLRRAAPKLSSMFESLDVNQDGTVSLEEFMHMSVDVFPQELFDNSSVSSLQEVFEILDISGKGFLSQSEFVEGLLNMFLLDVPIHTIQILRLLRIVESRINGLYDEFRELGDGSMDTSDGLGAAAKRKEIVITRKGRPPPGESAVGSDNVDTTNQVFTNNIAINQIVAEHLASTKN